MDASGARFDIPELVLSAGSPRPDPLASEGSEGEGQLTAQQVRERAADIQREAAWSMVKNVFAAFTGLGAGPAVMEADGDLSGLVGEINDLREQMHAGIRIPEVVIVGVPEIDLDEVVIVGDPPGHRPASHEITLPEVVITGLPSGPVIVMPEVVIRGTPGGGPDDDREPEQSLDGDGGLGDDTGRGDTPDIPDDTPIDVGGVQDGDGLGDDTGGGAPIPMPIPDTGSQAPLGGFLARIRTRLRTLGLRRQG